MATKRHQPRQARSRETIARILKTTAVLLEEVGLEGLNTNLIAGRAAVGMQAIYRYFPNKDSILLALMEELREAEREWVGDLRQLELGTWRETVRSSIAGYFAAAAAHTGYSSLRNAARASIAIQSADRALNAELERELAEGLERLGVRLEPSRMSAVCRTVMESASRILDAALASDAREAADLIGELTTMIVAYLEHYVPPAPDEA